MTTADYLESLQNDLDTIVSKLELDEGTNFTNIAEMTTQGEITKGGGGSGYTGHYDATGLAQIGWTSEDIKYYQDNGVVWNQELDNSYKLTADEIQAPASSTSRFIPKNSTYSSYAYNNRLLALPFLNNLSLNWNGLFRSCNNLITIPLFDTSNVTIMSSVFDSCYCLRSIPLLDTAKVTTMQNMFSYCYSLESVPLLNTKNVTTMSGMFRSCVSLRSIPQFNTENVTNMGNMFNMCSSLVSVPLLNTSKVTNFQTTFSTCYSLSDESLNNILKMCANATAYQGTKTLAYLGFQSSIYPATKIQALSNYQEFTNAGWTIGY